MKAPIHRPPDEAWESLVRQTARSLPYPPTPDVADEVMAALAAERSQTRPTRPHLQLLWAASLILALLLGLWAVPPVRAAILEFLQIGAVRIWLVEPTPPPAPAATPAMTPAPTPTPLRSLLDLAGRTTLAEAEAKAGFAIRLPTYPSDLGLPDEVFYQELDGPAVVLVWMDPSQPDQPAYSLHILAHQMDDIIFHKINPPTVMTTTVNGNRAVWAEGPYILAYGQGSTAQWQTRYLVSGRVLIWQEDGLTYRLESNLSVEEAIRMAESLE